MNSDYIQLLRGKLKSRLNRLDTVECNGFHAELAQIWQFLQNNEITKGVLDDLERCAPDGEQSAQEILNGKTFFPTTEVANKGMCYWVLKKCADAPDSQKEIEVGYLSGRHKDAGDCVASFRRRFVDPLFDYIGERIDDKRMVLALLGKYKQRCEWFRRSQLLAKWKAAAREGERVLAEDLYEYLHDQGLQFHIEPHSVSGRIDLISDQTGPDRLLAETKIFNSEGSQDRSYIAKGFRQIYDYMNDYSETFGYLVIYKTCEQGLSIPTPHQEAAVPFVTHNNKTIFLLVIDIFEYAETASKRGKLKPYEITPAQLIEAVQAAATTQGGPPDPGQKPCVGVCQ